MKIKKIAVVISAIAGLVLLAMHSRLIGVSASMFSSLPFAITSTILWFIYSVIVYVGFFAKNLEIICCTLLGFTISAVLRGDCFRIDFLPLVITFLASLVYIKFISPSPDQR